VLLDIAASIEPDGGMPGATPDERLLRTLAALMAMRAAGHTETSGAFRSHVRRLAEWLERNLEALSGRHREGAEAVLRLVRRQEPVVGGWMLLAQRPSPNWEELERLLAMSFGLRGRPGRSG
jgi:hypothetical protein